MCAWACRHACQHTQKENLELIYAQMKCEEEGVIANQDIPDLTNVQSAKTEFTTPCPNTSVILTLTCLSTLKLRVPVWTTWSEHCLTTDGCSILAQGHGSLNHVTGQCFKLFEF